MKTLVVSLHDVSPLTQTSCETILTQFKQLGIRQTSLLVIPNHHGRVPVSEDPTFRRWLVQKVEAGHEPVLHGYFHQRAEKRVDSFLKKLITGIYTAGEGEFFDLSTEEASRLARKGLEDLAFLRREIVGFVAPAWLLGPDAEVAICRLGFRYTTRLGRLRIFGRSADIRSLSLVWSTRARWRALISRAWNRWLAFRMNDAPLIRIGVHPSDLQDRDIWQQVWRLTAKLSLGRSCISYEKFIEIFRSRS